MAINVGCCSNPDGLDGVKATSGGGDGGCSCGNLSEPKSPKLLSKIMAGALGAGIPSSSLTPVISVRLVGRRAIGCTLGIQTSLAVTAFKNFNKTELSFLFTGAWARASNWFALGCVESISYAPVLVMNIRFGPLTTSIGSSAFGRSPVSCFASAQLIRVEFGEAGAPINSCPKLMRKYHVSNGLGHASNMLSISSTYVHNGKVNEYEEIHVGKWHTFKSIDDLCRGNASIAMELFFGKFHTKMEP